MKFSVFFLAILLFASCATEKDSKTGIERWKEHNIHNYNYKIRFDCECSFPGDYHVAVRNDTVVNVINSDGTEVISSPEYIKQDLLSCVHSFDGYYHWHDTLKADQKYLQQDSVYGYPKEGYIRDDTNSLHGLEFKIYDVEFLK